MQPGREGLQLLQGTGICKWFKVRLGFRFLSMTARAGVSLDPLVDVFVHQSKLPMEAFWSLKEGKAVAFTFKKSAKGLESIPVTSLGGVFHVGQAAKREEHAEVQIKRRQMLHAGGLAQRAKKCKLPPQPKKCHFCQRMSHMVASCPLKAQQAPSSPGKPAHFRGEEDIHSPALLPDARIELQWVRGDPFVIRKFQGSGINRQNGESGTGWVRDSWHRQVSQAGSTPSPPLPS